MEDILLIHRKTKTSPSKVLVGEFKPLTGSTVWKTCLRQIGFFDESSFDFTCEQDDQILRGGDALRFLLEILCGLHSPVLGETEVLGQFRLFLDQRRQQQDWMFSDNRKWLHFLLTEVKRLRCENVAGLGSNSYGGIVRKYSKGLDAVTVMGSGHLALEILPWLTHKKSVQVLARDPKKFQPNSNKVIKADVRAYQDAKELGTALIIAAPLSDQEIVNKVLGSNVVKIFDLRAEANDLKEILRSAQKTSAIQVMTLSDMFSELAQARRESEEKVQQIKEIIEQRVEQFMARSELRPMGWEDICA